MKTRPLRKVILGSILAGVDGIATPFTIRTPREPGIFETFTTGGLVLASASPRSESNGGSFYFAGAAITLTATMWRGFYPPAGFGPWVPFPLTMPGTNPGFVAQLQWNWAQIFPPYTWGVVSMKGQFMSHANTRGVTVGTGGGATIFTPPNGLPFSFRQRLDQTDLNALDSNLYNSIGTTQGTDTFGNEIAGIAVGLYTTPFPGHI